jgi:hypothetical protein
MNPMGRVWGLAHKFQFFGRVVIGDEHGEELEIPAEGDALLFEVHLTSA